jgi:hypothetical protein
MYTDTPNHRIPHIALYLALRGQHGEKLYPRNVQEARKYAAEHPDLGAEAEVLIARLYGDQMADLEELDRRYRTKNTKGQKQGVPWKEASELFVRGEIKRVLRMF